MKKRNEETEEVDFDQVHDIDNDKSPESQFSESESKRYSQVGFSTNGNIKLPTSKVTVIVPPTPVKNGKPPLIEDDIQPSSMTPPNYIILNFNHHHHRVIPLELKMKI